MKKAKCQLFVVPETYVDQLTAQLHKFMREKDENDGYLLAGMLALLKEHRIPRKATRFAQEGAIRTVDGVGEIVVLDTEIVRTWPFPKELLVEEKP